MKCIGIQMSVAKAPLNKPSLKEIEPSSDTVRVINLIFDTEDNVLGAFEDTVKSLKLSKVLKQENLANLCKNYPGFMKVLAK